MAARGGPRQRFQRLRKRYKGKRYKGNNAPVTRGFWNGVKETQNFTRTILAAHSGLSRRQIKWLMDMIVDTCLDCTDDRPEP